MQSGYFEARENSSRNNVVEMESRCVSRHLRYWKSFPGLDFSFHAANKL